MGQGNTRQGFSGQSAEDLSEDPRAAHTRAVLRQALLDLLAKGDWGAITVAGICRRAGVARSSFYEHYSSKAELLDQIFAEMLRNIRSTLRKDEPLGTLNWLVDHVAEAPDFFVTAMQGERGDALLPRFRRALIRRLTEELSARAVPDAPMKAAYLIGGSMTCLATHEPEEGRRFIHEMAMRVIG